MYLLVVVLFVVCVFGWVLVDLSGFVRFCCLLWFGLGDFWVLFKLFGFGLVDGLSKRIVFFCCGHCLLICSLDWFIMVWFCWTLGGFVLFGLVVVLNVLGFGFVGKVVGF